MWLHSNIESLFKKKEKIKSNVKSQLVVEELKRGDKSAPFFDRFVNATS
jgi:hypothetical protein